LGILNSSANTTPKLSRKRLRSVTPSEIPINGNSKEEDSLRSPLSKRKKLAADRTGYSKLKEAITADDLKEEVVLRSEAPSYGGVTEKMPEVDEDNDIDNEDEEDEEDEDDFLARELEEELG